ncbi:MAG: PD-(D/E)XK nuclease family protein, partial [Candidatus Latescibacteria bacterium]|nr:PD-(D/E)XK nuclease family protein [Candidatus Latescibacterota bacterium]
VLFDDRHIGHEWLENSGIRRIRETLLRLLRLRDRVTIRALVEEAFDLTGYTLTMLADPVEGELSLSVLDWFLQTADAFESNGGTLREFARLLERRSLPRDMASTVETRDDAVSIMTVHKSKGLEFKVVFLADIASPVRKSRNVVTIDSDMGIGFSYRIAAGGTVETLAARVAADTEALKDTAESKRLFYVGCTRAEDLLVITGGKPSNTADPLFGKDNWMGWLHAALDIDPDGSPGADMPADLVSYNRVDLSGRTFDVAPAEILRKSFEEARTGVAGDAVGLPAFPAILSMTGKPAHLSPTQILDYLDCPARYRFVYEYGLKGGGTVTGATGGRGEQYGSYAHRVMERLGAALKAHRPHVEPSGGGAPVHPPENSTHLPAGVVRYLSDAAEFFMKPAYPRNWKSGIEQELERFAATPLFKAIASAERIVTEEPFGFLHDGVLVRGVMDLVYWTEEDAVVVDYKTDEVEGEAVSEAVGRYSIQLGIYGNAVERAEYTIPARLVIYFLRPGVEYVVSCTRAFLDDTLCRISHAIGGISQREFPAKRAPRCDSCPFSRLCGSE